MRKCSVWGKVGERVWEKGRGCSVYEGSLIEGMLELRG